MDTRPTQTHVFNRGLGGSKATRAPTSWNGSGWAKSWKLATYFVATAFTFLEMPIVLLVLRFTKEILLSDSLLLFLLFNCSFSSRSSVWFGVCSHLIVLRLLHPPFF